MKLYQLESSQQNKALGNRRNKIDNYQNNKLSIKIRIMSKSIRAHRKWPGGNEEPEQELDDEKMSVVKKCQMTKCQMTKCKIAQSRMEKFQTKNCQIKKCPNEK